MATEHCQIRQDISIITAYHNGAETGSEGATQTAKAVPVARSGFQAERRSNEEKRIFAERRMEQSVVCDDEGIWLRNIVK